MPPSQFIATASGALDVTNETLTFAVPSTCKPGDHLIAIIAATTAVSGFDPDIPENAGWESLALFAGATATGIVARRIFDADTPSTVSLTMDAASASGIGALQVYRDLETSPAVGASSSNIAASTNFVCPSRDLTRYSDLYIGIVVVTSAIVAVTNPANTTERHEHGATAFELEIFDVLPETPGATGTKTATTAANQSGLAASIALAASGLRGGNKTLTGIAPIPGMLGLPTKGV